MAPLSVGAILTLLTPNNVHHQMMNTNKAFQQSLATRFGIQRQKNPAQPIETQTLDSSETSELKLPIGPHVGDDQLVTNMTDVSKIMII